MANSAEGLVSDLQGVCDSACAAIAHAGPGLLACVYLERGGRLRAHATFGHAQIRDGIPIDSGVVGRSFVAGAEIELRDVTPEEHFSLHRSALAKICMPIHASGEVVGVFDVESVRPISSDDTSLARRVAGDIGRRIEGLGGLPPESLSQKLARHVVALSGLRDLTAIQCEVLAAAIDLSPMSSAMLLTLGRDGDMLPRATEGPLADVLAGCSPEGLREMQMLVEDGNSAITINTGDSETIAAPAELSLGGVASTAVIARGINVGDVRGMLVLADSRSVTISREEVEAIEQLNASAATVIRAGVMYADLSTKAATDPLTGLGHKATFQAELASARPRSNLAVLLIDVDDFKRFNDTHGHQAGDRVLMQVASALSGAVRDGDSVFRIGGDEFAALVRVEDGEEALDAGARLRAAVIKTGEVTVSIGGALCGKEEADHDLFGRADRALYAVKARGRDGVQFSSGDGQQHLFF